MMADKKMYKIISKREDGATLFQVLEENKIEFSLVHNAFEVDTTFNGQPYQSDIQIFLSPSDFDRVDRLLADLAKSQLNLTDQNYYLFRFSTSELFEILRKKDEWSTYDYEFSKALLFMRGEDVSDARMSEMNQARINDLSKGEELPQNQLIFSYSVAFLGGILGILIGWYLWKSQKTLPNGQVVATYADSQRKHGKIIFMIGLIVSFLLLFVWIMSLVNG